MSEMSLVKIEEMIYVFRGQKVMLDSDLAELYGVETKRLNEQVNRNLERFPEDFMFQLSPEEYESLRSQFATSKKGKGGRRYQPLVFTENGVAMLSSVLNSSKAIQVNISIMRIFVKLRSFLAMETGVAERVGKFEKSTNHLFKVVFERLDALEESELPKYEHSHDRKRIGLKSKRD